MKKKILFITTFYGVNYGGAEVSTRVWYENLKNRFDIKIITTKNKKEKDVINLNFIYSIMPKKIFVLGNFILDFLLSRSIKRKISQLKPDIIHIQDTYILNAVVLAKTKIPLICTIRNIFPFPDDYPIPKFFIRLYKKREKGYIKSLKQCDQIITVSKFVKNGLMSMGIYSDKIFTIYNLPPEIKQDPIFSQVKNESKIIFFAPGRISIEKGYKTLANSLEYLKDKNDFKIVVAGDGDYLDDFNNKIKELDIEDKVVITGRLSQVEIHKLYKKSDIVLLLTEIGEPFSRIPLEAMSFGKPIVGTNTGGTPEAIRHNHNGILIEPKKPKLLAQTLINLLDKKSEIDRLSINTTRVLKKNFNKTQLIDLLIKIYNKY